MASVTNVVDKVKNSIYNRFVQYIISKTEIMDEPGFIVTRYTDKNAEIFLRELLLPEPLFVSIERAFADKFGKRGEQSLYSAGKKFGYRYATASMFNSLRDSPAGRIKKSVEQLVRYLEVVYANRISYKLDLERKSFETHMDQFVACRHTGMGRIWPEGAGAGLIANILADETIEGHQTKCQGRGDKECVLVCAPYKEVKAPFKETAYEGFENPQLYKTMNAIRKTKFAQSSFKSLADVGFYEYRPGVVMFQDERYFGCEASIVYLLEIEVSKLIGGLQLLFDVCYEYGKNVAKRNRDNACSRFITDYLSSLGWGDVFVGDDNYVSVSYFPWTKYSQKAQYVIFRGLMSGLLSGFKNKKVILNGFNMSDVCGYLNVRFF